MARKYTPPTKIVNEDDDYETSSDYDSDVDDVDSDTECEYKNETSEETSDQSDTEFGDEDEDEEEVVVVQPVQRVKKPCKKNRNEIFKELIQNQLKHIPSQWKLNISDMKRICKYIKNSIFDEDSCCIWNGYITNIHNTNKGTYVNFYFKHKKVALHRLLYSNFVAPLSNSEYLKFNCDNKGICCNINHYEKYKYSKNTGQIKKEPRVVEKKKRSIDIQIYESDDVNNLTLDFD